MLVKRKLEGEEALPARKRQQTAPHRGMRAFPVLYSETNVKFIFPIPDGVMLHMGKGLFIGHSIFEQIVDDNHAFIDKTLLIAEFLDQPTDIVPLVLRPRRFGKATDIMTLKVSCYTDPF
ncbi:2100_t:CDS:2 [Paraglomus brasilianum]|uniref:2100_t:CDS:1 n=1 Tax=Paraglomus brasilianum TaxID=144538 RepID=A0A9N9F6M2_9GLOM|nr:2100_t:CDS:2 [Paraglomus brasilianum]